VHDAAILSRAGILHGDCRHNSTGVTTEHSTRLAIWLSSKELADGPPIANRAGMNIIEWLVGFLEDALVCLYLAVVVLIASSVIPGMEAADVHAFVTSTVEALLQR
jgi:hypothetical protein